MFQTIVRAVIDKLIEAGATIKISKESVRVKMDKRPKAIDIETNAYPFFPTDMQAQMTALNSIADGDSYVKENIFENRFIHAQELIRMGAKIKVNNNIAKISGSEELWCSSDGHRFKSFCKSYLLALQPMELLKLVVFIILIEDMIALKKNFS